MPLGSAGAPAEVPATSAQAAPAGAALFLTYFPSIMLPMFLAALDQTIVATALPDIAGGLGDVGRVSWVVVAYLVSNTIAAPVYGRLGDALGRKRMMVVALCVFMAASALCGLASSILLLTGARLLQGLGGGGLMTLSQALIAEAVPPRQRGQYQGYLSGTYAMAATFGPVAGGVLTQHFGWPSVFWINLPLGVVAILLVLRLPRAAQRPGGRSGSTSGARCSSPARSRRCCWRWNGRSIRSRRNTAIVALLALAGVSLVLLLRQERRAPSPLLPIQLFRKPGHLAHRPVGGLRRRADGLDGQLPADLSSGGARRDPGAIGAADAAADGRDRVGSLFTGRMIARTGWTAVMPSIGLAVSVAALLVLALFAPSLSNTVLIGALALISCCTGTAMPVVQMTVQVVAGPPGRRGGRLGAVLPLGWRGGRDRVGRRRAVHGARRRRPAHRRAVHRSRGAWIGRARRTRSGGADGRAGGHRRRVPRRLRHHLLLHRRGPAARLVAAGAPDLDRGQPTSQAGPDPEGRLCDRRGPRHIRACVGRARLVGDATGSAAEAKRRTRPLQAGPSRGHNSQVHQPSSPGDPAHAPSHPPASRRADGLRRARFHAAGNGPAARIPAPPRPALARPAPDSFADLAARLLPAVVNISSSADVQVGDNSGPVVPPVFPPGSPFEQFFKDFMERHRPDGGNANPAPDRRMQSLGSGFIIDPSGLVVTNNHVIEGADEITVTLQDNTSLKAKVLGRDQSGDLALLKVDAGKPLPALAFGDSAAMRVGDWVLAIGNPFGLGGTVTAGIVSARGRDIHEGPYDDFIQTDAPINRGNSGGPLFNMDGQVIGINTAIYSPSGGSIGIGFAIPSKMAQLVVAQLRQFGHPRRGWLGVRIQEVTPDIADSLSLHDGAHGALVAGVNQGGPADQAHLRNGDVVLSFNGAPVKDMRALPRIVADTDVGKQVPLTVWRDGKEVTLQAVLAEKPDDVEKAATTPVAPPPPQPAEIAGLGITLAPIDQAARDRFHLGADQKGVVVTDVAQDGAAGQRGLKPGDVIVEVQQGEVSSPDDVRRRVEAVRREDRRSVLMLIQRADGLSWVPLPLDASKDRAPG